MRVVGVDVVGGWVHRAHSVGVWVCRRSRGGLFSVPSGVHGSSFNTQVEEGETVRYDPSLTGRVRIKRLILYPYYCR